MCIIILLSIFEPNVTVKVTGKAEPQYIRQQQHRHRPYFLKRQNDNRSDCDDHRQDNSKSQSCKLKSKEDVRPTPVEDQLYPKKHSNEGKFRHFGSKLKYPTGNSNQKI